MMNLLANYINFQKKLHEFLFKNSSSPLIKKIVDDNSDVLEEELAEVYDRENLSIYELKINKLISIFVETSQKLSFREKEIKTIKKLADYFSLLAAKIQMNETNFFNVFLAYSLHNNLVDEKFIKYSEQRSGKKKNSIFEVINNIAEELLIFLQFVSTFNNEGFCEFNVFDLKKFLFRCILNISSQVDFITIEKQLVFKESVSAVKYTNFISYNNFIKPKTLTHLFKTSSIPPFLKKNENIILIGFFHYSNNIPVLSNKKFKPASILTPEFITTLEKYGATAYYIDKEMLNIIDQRLSIIEKNNVELNLKKLNLQNILKNKNIHELAQNDDINKIDTLDALLAIKHKIRFIQKELSINIDIWVFREFKRYFWNKKKPIYFIPYADFRGRFYLKSFISPQNSWLYRFSYFFATNETVLKNENILLPIDLNIEKKIKDLEFKHINKAAWVFLSIGFKFKLNIQLENFSINLNILIERGIEEYLLHNLAPIELFKKFSKNIDACEVIYYFKILNDLKSSENYIQKNRYIIKDTTASVYQHLGKLLSFKDNTALELNNLTSEIAWFDTYQPIIQEIIKVVDPELQLFFTRQSLKKIIMTTKYNIEFSSAIKYFNEEIGYIDDVNNYKKIISAFSKIFRLLKNGIIENKLLFKTPLKDFNKSLNNYALLNLKDMTVNLVYLIKKKKEINVFFEEKRYVLANYEVSNEVDKLKMQVASLPNVIHSLDALYARKIINEFILKKQNIFTIHDAFAVSLDNIEFLITTAWKSFNIEETFTFKSIENLQTTIPNFNKPLKPKSLTIII